MDKTSRVPRSPPAQIVRAIMHVTNFLQRVRRKLLPPEVVVLELMSSHYIVKAILIAVQLRLADLLTAQPRSINDLAQATGADADVLYRWLRVLISAGIFAQRPDGTIALTPTASALRSDASGPVRGVAALAEERWYRDTWSEANFSVTGKSVFEHVHGMKLFEYFRQNTGAWRVFNDAMTRFSEMASVPVARGYDFSWAAKLIDVGGGHGHLLATVLATQPRLHGVLYDQPDVVAGARPTFERVNVLDRCEFVGGDFFERVPTGGDAYMMKHIVHDWGDDKAAELLAHCRSVIPTHGRLLVIEAVIPDNDEPQYSKFMDIDMMVLTENGRERTEPQYRELLRRAGFELQRVVPTASPLSVLEATPV